MRQRREQAQKARNSWQCPDCRACEVCGSVAPTRSLLTCSTCQAVCHAACAGPATPDTMLQHQTWFCTSCAKCDACGTTEPGTRADGQPATWLCDFKLCHDCGTNKLKGNFCPICGKVGRTAALHPPPAKAHPGACMPFPFRRAFLPFRRAVLPFPPTPHLFRFTVMTISTRPWSNASAASAGFTPRVMVSMKKNTSSWVWSQSLCRTIAKTAGMHSRPLLSPHRLQDGGQASQRLPRGLAGLAIPRRHCTTSSSRRQRQACSGSCVSS